MATIVLTTVGGIIGGPIGAAVGGLIGNAIDRDVIFKPAGRQGPRLTELAVQTSSYGTKLPRLFGTMRVAGSVIWSTDLIESHTTSGHGKGQPSTTTYSYSASFAVALSARAVAGVARIWADGKLLRGAGGDWKSGLGAFRLHPGDEDQPVDPLIASAEGECPAHRGLAYAVFEQLQLADFGNRIPSLTFELTADASSPSVGAIAAELGGPSTRSGQALIDGSAAPMPLDGFSAYGDSVRGVLETLAEASGGWWAPVGDGLALRCAADPVTAVADAGFAAKGDHPVRARSVAPIERAPRTVSVAHYDPARDYQAGLQRARRPGPGETDQRIELPAALSAGAAKSVAEAALTRAEAGRVTRTVSAGLEALAIAPGDAVTLVSETGAGEAGSWRVTDAELNAMVVTLTLVPLALAPPLASASGGRVLAAPDVLAGRTLLAAAELPAFDDALLAQPRLTILAAGTEPGWRRASLTASTDGGAHWSDAGVTAAPAVIGTLLSAPGAGSPLLVDTMGVIDVALAHGEMALAGADDVALDAGANLALVGDELIQFGRAAQLTATHWRLTRLLRGRRGTEAMIASQQSGALPGSPSGSVRFVLLTRATGATIDLPAASVGGAALVSASGVGDGDAPAEASAPLTGASVLPPSPVRLRAERLAGGGATLRWVRRSRLGWRWLDGGDAPLGEERERYRVTLPGRAWETDGPEAMLSADDLATGGVVEVRQLGTNGASPAAALDLAVI